METKLSLDEQNILLVWIKHLSDSPKMLARRLDCSESELQTQIKKLRRKTGAKNRVELLRWAVSEALKVQGSLAFVELLAQQRLNGATLDDLSVAFVRVNESKG